MVVVAAVGRQGVDSLCSLFYLLLLQAAPTYYHHHTTAVRLTRPDRLRLRLPQPLLAPLLPLPIPNTTHNYQLRNTALVLVVQLVEEVSGSSGGVAG